VVLDILVEKRCLESNVFQQDRNWTILFTQNLHNVQILCEQEKSTLLPQAILAFIGANVGLPT